MLLPVASTHANVVFNTKPEGGEEHFLLTILSGRNVTNMTTECLSVV